MSSRKAKSRLNVVLLVHTEFFDPSDPDFLNVTPDTESEHFVSAGLRALGHRVSVLPFKASPKGLATLGEELQQLQPDLAFNFIEHIHGDRRLGAKVPALLEKLRIPYTGASATGTLRSIDKGGSKNIVSTVGFPVPSFVVVPQRGKVSGENFPFPALVKPQFGGASVGLRLASVVNTKKDLLNMAREIHRKLDEPAICEQYIEGRELSVGLVEDGKQVLVLPIRETVFSRAAEGGPRFCTERVKDSYKYRDFWGIRYERAQLTPKLDRRIKTLCRDAFRALDLTGYARIDLRVNADGDPIFLEANSNPDLAPRYFGIMGAWMGLTYEDVLVKILRSGLNRSASPR